MWFALREKLYYGLTLFIPKGCTDLAYISFICTEIGKGIIVNFTEFPHAVEKLLSPWELNDEIPFNANLGAQYYHRSDRLLIKKFTL